MKTKSGFQSTSRSIVALSMIVAMLVLGFCPLRNILGTLLLRPESAIPKTNGAHLLNANDVCKIQSIEHGTVSWHKTSLPPFGLSGLISYHTYDLYSFNRNETFGLSNRKQINFAIPIYLRNRVWRI